MGRIIPFIILASLIGLAGYAGLQAYALIKKQPITTAVSLPQIFPKSTDTPVPTEIPQVTLFPTPTPNPGIKSYLQTYLLNASSTCVFQILGQDDAQYFLWAICRNPSASISIPVALKLDLSSHQTPGAGESYDSDLIRIFPQTIRNHEIFSNSSLLDTLQSQLP